MATAAGEQCRWTSDGLTRTHPLTQTRHGWFQLAAYRPITRRSTAIPGTIGVSGVRRVRIAFQ